MSLSLAEAQIGWHCEEFIDFCQKRISGLSLGIPELDKTLLGLRGIMCIRGAPATNKSTLALQLAHHYAKNHGPVFYFDRENGRNRLRQRILCQEFEVSEIGLLERLAVEQSCLKYLVELPLYIQSAATPEELIEDLTALWKQYKKPVLLVVDSLQKLPLDLSERRNSLDRWLMLFDELKVKHEKNLKFIIISEKNKQGYDTAAMSSSKDSSEIEYTAETILDLRQNPKTNNILCNIAKDRDGPIGFEFEFKRKLVEAGDPRSFCFKLYSEDQLIF